MRWCTQCRRYTAGHPRYCPTCGRTFEVRLCRRGHVNSRHVDFCTDCGSDELSTAAPPEPWIEAIVHRASVLALPLAMTVVVAVVAIGITLMIISANMMPAVVGLGIIFGGWYWLSRRIPPMIRRLGTL